jgi:site-specific DNA-methyltransferase (adenine-specific)
VLNLNNVHVGDCLNLMTEIEDQSIDMILCDLPYGTTSCKWDIVIPFIPMWDQYKRIIKHNGAVVLFGSEPFSSHLRLSNLEWFKYDWIWEKSNPSNIALANKQPMKYHEIISVFCSGSPPYYKQMIDRTSPRIKQAQKCNYTFHNSQSEQTSLRYHEVSADKYSSDKKNPSSVLKFNSLRPNAKEFCKHPTQKPVSLCEYLIKTYTKEDEVVLDNCAGSGTTGVACKNLNRSFILIEKEEKYCDIIRQRLNL